MKNLLLLTLCFWSRAFAQISPTADTFTYTGAPTTNYGAAPVLEVVGGLGTSYIQFNSGSIPTVAVVSQATLKLYVSSVITAGSFTVDYVDGTWTESTLTYSGAPLFGGAIVPSVPITTADVNQYILIDITPAVVAWLNGSQQNDGIALVAEGALNASFDSKENTTTSHPPELDVVFAGTGGTITGVTAGTGLSGGGSSGNVTLNNTGILGLTGGTGISIGSGQTPTVSVSAAVPLLAANNTFTGNQTVNGNLGATGVISSSGYEVFGLPFAFGNPNAENAFLGFAGNATMTGSGNTASGARALASNTVGGSNTAIGVGALYANSVGYFNTAVGAAALQNGLGAENTAVGYGTLNGNGYGMGNTAVGMNALLANADGSFNTGLGNSALQFNTGTENTAVGASALFRNITGNSNIAIGITAGYSQPTGNSDSIYIGSQGSAGDVSGTIQIGRQGTQNGGTYIAGISGANLTGGAPVYVNGNGQLGTVLSSRRFKDQIADMGDTSSKLLQLRPVTYFYKPEYDDGSHLPQYGLVAEEVAKVYPEMVAYDKDGQILTVKYQLLAPMLLNEVQKQEETIRQLKERLTLIEAMLAQTKKRD